MVRNPDEAIATDPNAYELLLSEPVIIDAMMNLAAPLVNAEQEVTGTGDPGADERLSEILNSMVWLPECKEQLSLAFITGMRLVENVWGHVTLDDGTTYVAPTEFIPHSNSRFAYDPENRLFMTQDYYMGGGSTRNDQILTYSGNAAYVRWGKMLSAVYKDGDGRNGYGKGEGLVLYRFMQAKQAVMGYWLDYLARFGVPPVKYGLDQEYISQRVANGEEVSSIVATETENVAAMRANDSFVYDKRNTLEFHEPSTGAQVALYENLLRYCDEQMRMVITGEGSSPNGEGDGRPYATLADIGAGNRAQRVKRLGAVLERTLANDLIRPIMKYNHEFAHVRNSRPKVVIKTAMIPAGEQLDLALRFPFPIRKAELYNLARFSEPTKQEVDKGEAVVPSQAGGGDPMLGGAML